MYIWFDHAQVYNTHVEYMCIIYSETSDIVYSLQEQGTPCYKPLYSGQFMWLKILFPYIHTI